MTHYYITWQPDVAEDGDYFLTHIESERSDLSMGELLDRAFEMEDIDRYNGGFRLCSILRCNAPAVVVH